MDEKLLRKLLKKTSLIKYKWSSNKGNLWNAEYLNNSEDRINEYRYLMGEMFNTYSCAYLYSERYNQFTLIAIVKGDKLYVK